MSFYNSEFFAGCESLMEDETNLPAEDLPVDEAVVEQQEAADAAAEPVEAIAEQEKVAEATEQMLAKFDEIDRMIAYVGQYGVDKSFLSLCNHDDILNQAFNLGLPATESFEEAGDPNSAVSQAAMEGLKEAAKSVWDWIKKAWARIKQFFADAWAKVTGWFKKTPAAEVDKTIDQAASTPKAPTNEQQNPEKKTPDPNELKKTLNFIEKAIAGPTYEARNFKEDLRLMKEGIQKRAKEVGSVSQADIAGMKNFGAKVDKVAAALEQKQKDFNAEMKTVETQIKNAESKANSLANSDAEGSSDAKQDAETAKKKLTEMQAYASDLVSSLATLRQLKSEAKRAANDYTNCNRKVKSIVNKAVA